MVGVSNEPSQYSNTLFFRMYQYQVYYQLVEAVFW